MPSVDTVPGVVIGAYIVALPMLFTLPKTARLLLNSRFGAVLASTAACAAIVGFVKYEDMAISFNELLVACVPALQIAIGAISYHLFVWLRGVPPAGTLFNGSYGLAWDRVFAISVASVCVLLPVSLLLA